MFHGEFVGRESELERLSHALELALRGTLTARLVTGGGGTGKSRLIQEFIARARRAKPELLVITGECNAQTGSTQPYLPFIELMNQLVGDAQDRRPEPAAGLGVLLATAAGVAIESLLSVAPDLLSLMIPGVSKIATKAMAMAERRGWKQRLLDSFKPKAGGAKLETTDRKLIFEQCTALFHQMARSFPLVVVIDDLQWSDEPSLALFFHLILKRVDLPLLIIGSYRTAELEAQMQARGQALETAKNAIADRYGDAFIDLERLPTEVRRAFVAQYLGIYRHRFDAVFVERLFETTAAQPLLLGELLTSLSEQGKIELDEEGYWICPGRLDWSALPRRIEGVLAERLQRLDARVYDILEAASVQGRSFVVPAVARTLGLEELELVKLLARELDARHHLVAESAIERVGERWLATYTFDNLQLQQYLYNRISQRGRMLLHDRAGELLEELYEGYAGTIERVLAYHYEHGGRWRKAAHFHRLAGLKAFQLGAGREAISHFEQALALLEQLPLDMDLRKLKVDTYLPYSNVLKVTHGWNSPEILDALYRARGFCRDLGAEDRLMPFMFSLWANHLTRLDLASARTIALENTALGKRLDSPEILVHGYFAQSNTEFWLGEFESCAAHVAQANELSRRIADLGSCTERYGQDPRSLIMQFEILSAWMLGRAEQTQALLAQGERLLVELDQPLSKAIMLTTLAWQAFNAGEVEACHRHAGALLHVSVGMAYYHPFAELFLGWTQGVHEEPLRGLERVERAYAEMCTQGPSLLDPVEALIACDLLRRLGRVQPARQVIQRSLESGLTHDNLAYRAELLRVRAELGAPHEPALTAAALQEALALAREQGAQPFVARIERSLAGLVPGRAVDGAHEDLHTGKATKR